MPSRLLLRRQQVLDSAQKPAAKPEPPHADQAKQEPPKLVVKRRPRFLVEAVALLASDTSEGKVGLGALGRVENQRELITPAAR